MSCSYNTIAATLYERRLRQGYHAERPCSDSSTQLHEAQLSVRVGRAAADRKGKIRIPTLNSDTS